MPQKGMLLVYTGDGKGKTTASLGVTLRAIGRGMKVKYFQFIKSPERTYGEQLALRKLGVETVQLGIGFTWTKTQEEHREALATAWQTVKEELKNETTDVLVLDELNNALAITRFPIDDVLPLSEVLEAIQNRPESMHLVITGRSAHPAILELADLVSTINATKHYYAEQEVKAMKGLEF
ncbi:cob(I)yrinic acid a,c-diamide adenosyltransferase [Cytobacillus firmus]|uniref:cob(I)yrinic acid a,c-diamide adenosyltransferase n=1 Tax=Cytobacillus firmus TaxID=1399 RepID=UPI0018CD8203|nr:cob(I)yrinic acid a,c-diamide adenosyltransferase [Cytobacillus firmus]MBG9549099.1 cobinamide adenolsyltransferase [Cytobacillus firmus]MBG9603064.1 cobinamide adenolsyltransferase [Cytobacillus firmus]MBG9654957.1 cobinamide adenolsyltransferase [Cytobacillus firmus]MED1907694.1 cob(I)yrinic acid a,c-diamide adenosyltransferase [Cytobacillus firmus]MED1939745.1 cob(I)yrinic acid a,c-diamide adenosyltransferase [Cytobacillus firmus]